MLLVVVTSPMRISFLYTVSMPGYMGDLKVSSNASTVTACHLMPQSTMPSMSFDSRSAACNELSWGNLAFWGREAPGAMRPSDMPSVASTRILGLPSGPLKISFTTTMSTARTMNLCLVASSNSRDPPVCKSATNSAKVFAPLLPKPSILMLCIESCCLTVSNVTSRLTMSHVGNCFAVVKAETKLLDWEVCHHSKVRLRSVAGSVVVKNGFLKSTGPAPVLPFAFCRRSTSSARRWAMPALAPASFISGLNSVSVCANPGSRGSPHFLPSFLIQTWLAAMEQSYRLISSRSSRAWTSSAPSSGHLLGTESFLNFTSSSPLNGNLPEIRPNITTPTAQQSTFIA
mmetsp:Transcript_10112/g.25943  ORF Transcript_10112/g.25943 Transcript_10112/m.25943 type:complete len:344 (+) Transcript_10112:1062-2093(+)